MDALPRLACPTCGSPPGPFPTEPPCPECHGAPVACFYRFVCRGAAAAQLVERMPCCEACAAVEDASREVYASCPICGSDVPCDGADPRCFACLTADLERRNVEWFVGTLARKGGGMNASSPYREGGREIATMPDATDAEVQFWETVYDTVIAQDGMGVEDACVDADAALGQRRARFGRR